MLSGVDLPFPRDRLLGKEPGFTGNSLSQFSEELQEVAGESVHLADYLRAIPVEEIGIPSYHVELSKKLGNSSKRNFIYPIEGDLFVHIYPNAESERDTYVTIEPTLTVELEGIMEDVELKLLEMAEEIGSAPEEQRRRVLLYCLDRVYAVGNGDLSPGGTGVAQTRGMGNKIRVPARVLAGIRYLVLRDKLGLGALQPLLQDPYIEDISCSGTGSVFLEHKVFKSLQTTLTFPSLDDLDDFVVWMGERIKRPVTLRHPIVDAVLPDGSRINIVYGRDIAKRGSNFTIRKFGKDPLSIVQLVEFGTMSYMMAAYLWFVMEEGMNLFIAGTTASGKTTTLNAITTFIPAHHKIVSIEDTPELQAPHENWIREVVREMSQKDGGGSVGMFDLLKAALRQRPDRIVIGEIRGEEGNIAFQAMQTGHGVMSTFHAASVEKLIQRLTGDPINVPKPYVDNLDVAVIQAAVRGPDGKTVRRVTSINEIVGYDPVSSSFTFITAFRWRAENDTFEFPGDNNSYLLEQKVAMKRGLPDSKRRMIYSELRRRAAILRKLQRGGVDGFQQLYKVLAGARKQGLF
jgi:flagellar protein FlaI